MASLSWVFSGGRKPEPWLEPQKTLLFYPAENKYPRFELGFHPEKKAKFSFLLSVPNSTYLEENKEQTNNQLENVYLYTNKLPCMYFFLANSFKLGWALTLQHYYEQRIPQYVLT